MSKITIADLEVFFRVGVTDEERAKPQRLLLTAEMTFDFTQAAQSDRLNRTIDYFSVSQDLLKYGDGRDWKLIEKLAVNLADLIKTKYSPEKVTIEVKKFVIPQAAYVSVTFTR